MNVINNTLIINVYEKNLKKEISNTKKYIKFCNKNNLNIKYNYKLSSDEDIKKIREIEKAINTKDIKERYSYIYDTVCDYLDTKYLECNYCDFKDNICVYFRNNPKISHKDGCCYSDARGGLCDHLKNNKCDIRSISCKLYSCEYLRKNKINFRMKQFPLIKYFFNIKQKYFIKYSFFKPKIYVIYKLLSSNKN